MTTQILRSADDSAPSDLLTMHVAPPVLSVDGEIDVWTEPRFRAILVDAVRRDDVTVVDLSGVTFFGSAGIEPFVDFARRFDGRVVTSTAIDRLLALLDIDVDSA